MKNSKTNTRFIQFADHSVKFESDSPDLLESVDIHFAHCLGGNENLVGEYQVKSAAESKFNILRDGEEYQSDLTMERVLFNLMQDGLTKLNGAAETNMIFHAAGLALDDRGLWLCGRSGSGKTTLTAWLTASGFQYLSDEVLAYPPAGGEARGFCRSLVLKKGSSAVWERWLEKDDSNAVLKMEDGSAWIPPTVLNPAAVRERAEPGLVIFPTYKEKSEFEIEKLTMAGTVFHLMQSLVNARNFSDHGMGGVKTLAQKVSAYKLTYSDIDQAEAWIRKTLAA
jgi:hypothetical protein